MEAPTIHEQRSDFDERNSFLFFVLGLVSVSRHLTAQLADNKPLAEPGHAQPPPEDKETDADRLSFLI